MNLKRFRKIIVSSVIILVASATFAFEKWNSPSALDPGPKVELLSVSPSTTRAVGQDDLQTDAQEAEGKVLLLSVKPTGFVSNEITVASGNYLVVVSNKTGLAELNLQVTREGDRSELARELRGRRHLKQFLRMVPGTYVLSELAHPEWVCRVVVE